MTHPGFTGFSPSISWNQFQPKQLGRVDGNSDDGHNSNSRAQTKGDLFYTGSLLVMMSITKPVNKLLYKVLCGSKELFKV